MVAASVRADLSRWERRLPGIGESGLAAMALSLAERMDDPHSSPTAVSNCARVLNETLDRIVALLPAEARLDAVDELISRRERRRAS